MIGPPFGQWTHAEVYDHLKHLGSRDWAWEFLRRNEAYVSDWHHVTSGDQGRWPDLKTMMARFFALDAPSRWGVIFRGRSPKGSH